MLDTQIYQSGNSKLLGSVTADGVKTISALLDDLYALVKNALTNKKYILYIYMTGVWEQVWNLNMVAYGEWIRFSYISQSSTASIRTAMCNLKDSSSTSRRFEVTTTSAVTYIDEGTDVPTNGTVYSIIESEW